MTNVEFYKSNRGKMLLLSKLSFKRFFGKRSALFLSCLVFGVITQALLQSAEAQIKYTVTRLVPITGVPSFPDALNAQGDVVGTYTWRNGTNHFFLNHAGIMHDIAALAGSFPSGINIYGRIVGNSLANVGPFTYFEKKAWTLSRTIPGFTAGPVNTASHIACSSNSGAFIWQKSGLTVLPAPQFFSPTSINNGDQVVGNAYVPAISSNHGFLISGGQAFDLGTFQNLPGPQDSFAYGLNDQGQIAGYSVLGGARHAFIYSEVNSGGKMQDIQTIDPSNTEANSFGYGINNSGQVVGQFFYYAELPHSHAFIYDGAKIGSQMIYLETLIDPAAGWLLDIAWAINDAGQIIATGYYQNEAYTEACLLTPIR